MPPASTAPLRCLLALAVQHGGCLVTLDQAISLSSVPGARPEHLRLL